MKDNNVVYSCLVVKYMHAINVCTTNIYAHIDTFCNFGNFSLNHGVENKIQFDKKNDKKCVSFVLKSAKTYYYKVTCYS